MQDGELDGVGLAVCLREIGANIEPAGIQHLFDKIIADGTKCTFEAIQEFLLMNNHILQKIKVQIQANRGVGNYLVYSSLRTDLNRQALLKTLLNDSNASEVIKNEALMDKLQKMR